MGIVRHSRRRIQSETSIATYRNSKAVLSPCETPRYADHDVSETIKPEHCSETLHLDRTLGPVGDVSRGCATLGRSGNEVGGECNMCRAEGNKGMYARDIATCAQNANGWLRTSW